MGHSTRGLKVEHRSWWTKHKIYKDDSRQDIERPATNPEKRLNFFKLRAEEGCFKLLYLEVKQHFVPENYPRR